MGLKNPLVQGNFYPVYREIKMALLCWPELMSVQFATDIFAECGKIAPKLKFDLGSVPL